MSKPLEPEPTGTELNEAVGLFRAGRLREAERACRRVLAKQAKHARALHLLALIADRAGRKADAVGLAQRAAACAPDDATMQHGLGDLLLRTGNAADAIATYERAHTLDPASPFILASLGHAWLFRNEPTKAENAYRAALKLKPDYAGAHNNLGNVLSQQGRRREAELSYRRAIALDPRTGGLRLNLARLLDEGGRADEAHALLTEALVHEPNNPHVQAALARVACKRDDRKASGTARPLETAFSATPRAPHEDALQRHSASAHVNVGTVPTSREHLEEAVQSVSRATELNPNMAEALLNLGVALHNEGRFEEALTQYRRAIGVRLDYPEAHMGEAFALLTLGRDFPEALRKLEWRWRLPDRKPRGFAQPLWLGEPLEGKIILLHAEEGFDDSLMLLRYAPLVAACGGRVIIEVPKALVRLAKTIACGPFPVIAEGSPLPAFALHCPLTSLPLALGTTAETIPSRVPYLGAAPEDVRRWSEELSDAPGLKVGIAWAGDPHRRSDERRSIPLDRFAALFDVPSVRWFSLQVGARASDLVALPPGKVKDLSPQLTDFAENAAAILNLDLVIAVDTAVAHLAGALGRPGWVMLPFSPDWRWLLDREDNPWYPTLRLYRQRAPGEWDDVISRVATDVAALASARGALRGK